MNDGVKNDSGPDEEIKQLMEDYSVDEDVAEKAKELINTEGLDEDGAIELAEDF